MNKKFFGELNKFDSVFLLRTTFLLCIYSLFIVHIGDDDDEQKRRKEQSKKVHEERTIEYFVVHQMEKPEICMFS